MLHSTYEKLSGRSVDPVPEDLAEPARSEQPENFFRYAAALSATKTGDGLVDPKLVLAWLFHALGAPTGFVGLLVPIREAGSLLPQLALAPRLAARPRRRGIWSLGSALQGCAVVAMGAVALTLEGRAAGLAILAALVVFALARSLCSVTAKDVLGKTVTGSTRGAASGVASTVSAVAVLAFAVALSLRWIPLEVRTIAWALFVAGGLWFLAAVLFSGLAEPESDPGAASGEPGVLGSLGLLREDPQLARFVLARGLMTSTALAPPFLISLSSTAESSGLGELGPFVLASSIAALVSSYVWGRLADVSSRRVLSFAGLVAFATLTATAALAVAAPDVLAAGLWLPAVLFALSIAYRGVRMGRKVHLVDMAPEDRRASYTAVSNTLIGIVLIAGSGLGVVAALAGASAVLAVLAALSLLGAWVAFGLDEVQTGSSG